MVSSELKRALSNLRAYRIGAFAIPRNQRELTMSFTQFTAPIAKEDLKFLGDTVTLTS